MKLRTLCVSFAGAFLSLTILTILNPTPAYAQATRTWVSGVGDDANPCSRTAPCKTFAGAISKTASSGEIDCLDPGGFGTLTITKPITIICASGGGLGGVLASGTQGFVVALSNSTDRVILDGMDIEGAGNGTNGVKMSGVGQVIIRNSTIRDFATNGVLVQPSSAATPNPRVLIINCLITNNGTANASNSGGVTFVPSVSTAGAILNSVIDSNINYNLSVGNLTTVIMSASALAGTSPNNIVVSGGNLISFGNNVLRNAGSPTTTVPLQ